MKKWIKIGSDLMQDERIRLLMEDYGAKGLGVYLAIRLLTDCKEGCAFKVVLNMLGKIARQRLVEDIILSFGLFVIDKLGYVRHCDSPEAPADARIDARINALIDAPTHAPAQVHTPDHIVSLNKDIDVDVDISRARQHLLSETNLPWREPMMMHSGYGRLLTEHWEQAVDYFLGHVMAQDNVHILIDEHEVRQYFANFSRLSKPTGKAMKEYLLTLRESNDNDNDDDNDNDNELWK